MKKIITVLATFILVFSLAACNSDEPEAIEHTVPKENPINISELPYSEYLSLKNPVVTITVKDMGEIKIQLFPDVAPNAVNNFIQYIQDGAYENNSFHRVVNDFVIQGGQLETPACGITGEFSFNDFPNEVSHDRGIISMARVGNDYGSATSQFFIIEQTSNFLDGSYASFGGMISGFTVLSYIAEMQEEDTEVPTSEVIIESITVDLKDYVPLDRVCVEEN